MDALGLAANILQLIDFAWKLAESASEIASSVSGTTRDSSDLIAITRRLDKITEELVTNPEYHNFVVLSTRCQVLSKELLETLESIRNKSGSKRGIFKAVIKTKWKGDDIASIRRRLNEYRDQILLEITSLVKKDQTLIRADVQSLGETTVQIQDEIRRLQTGVLAKIDDAKVGGIEAIIALQIELGTFQRHVQQVNQRYCILKALRYKKMEERFDTVPRAYEKTFEWIFRSDLKWNQQDESSLAPEISTSFSDWLQTGQGIFHILGKAGSGKSTLMKFICNSPVTTRSLDSWCGGKDLVSGQFFFWKPGTPMQRSLKGLIRSLLYTILDRAPELIERTFPDVWRKVEELPWNVPCDIDFSSLDIPGAFSRLIENENTYKSHRFCFFIDGLDEFDEFNGLDSEQTCYTDLIDLLTTWARNRPEVKLCVSSRDWALFKGAFSVHQKLRLQDLTENDMKTLVRDTLQGHGNSFDDVSHADPQVSQLVDDIVSKAEGIFLWVVLVLKSLRKGLQNKDSAKMLRMRLEKMPAGLEEFLGFMLEGIDSLYLPHSALMFAIAMSERDWSLLRYSFLEDIESNPRYALEEATVLDEQIFKKRLERMRFQLDACSKGLLEARKIPRHEHDERLPTSVLERVTFIHRSVRDFLEDRNRPKDSDMVRTFKRDIAEMLQDASVLNHVAHSFLAEIKSVNFERGYFALGSALGDAAKSMHEVWSKTGPPDFEFLNALDTVLQRPIQGVSPDFSKIPHEIFTNNDSVGHAFVAQNLRLNQWGEIKFLDVFGTFAYYGFGEFLTKDDANAGSVCGRSIDYLLYCVLESFEKKSDHKNHFSVNTSDCIKFAERLLVLGSKLDTIVYCNDYFSYTNWESFIIDTFYDRECVVHDTTADMLLFLLNNGADPYIWLQPSSENEEKVVLYHASKGLIFYDCDGDYIRSEKTTSLREVIEQLPPHNANEILLRLPSQAEYELEWNSSRVVSMAEVREMQGYVELPEVQKLIKKRIKQ